MGQEFGQALLYDGWGISRVTHGWEGSRRLKTRVCGLGWLKNGLSWDWRPRCLHVALQRAGFGVSGLFTWCLRGSRVGIPSEQDGGCLAFYESASEEMQQTRFPAYPTGQSSHKTEHVQGMVMDSTS